MAYIVQIVIDMVHEGVQLDQDLVFLHLLLKCIKKFLPSFDVIA